MKQVVAIMGFLFVIVGTVSAQSPSVSVTVTPNDTICLGDTVHLQADFFGTYSTDGIDFNGVTCPAVSIGGTINTAIDLFLLYHDSGACSFTCYAINGTDTASEKVTIVILWNKAKVSMAASSATVCPGESVSFTATPTNGGTSPFYQWSVNGNPCGPNSPYYASSSLQSGDVVSVNMTSNAPCVDQPVTASYTAQVITPVDPAVNINPNVPTTCAGGYLTFTAIPSGGGSNPSYQWQVNSANTGTNGNTFLFPNPAAGDQVSVILTSNAACLLSNTAADTVTVNINPFAIAPGNSYTICSGSSVQLSVSQGSSWTWLPSPDLNCNTCQDPVATPSVTTIYTVVATQLGCTASTTDTIAVVPSASAVFTSSVVSAGLPQPISFQNNSQNATGYQWNFGDQNFSTLISPTHAYIAQGTYPVVLIAYGNNGCNDTTTIELIVTDTIGIIIPNIFTPNADGVNDVFTINIHGFVTQSLIIFDRWGLKIFESNDQASWDGTTTSGVLCSEGTYYYIFSGTDFRDTLRIRKGWIQLDR